jgi:hypothetical protein
VAFMPAGRRRGKRDAASECPSGSSYKSLWVQWCGDSGGNAEVESKHITRLTRLAHETLMRQ